MRIYKQYVYTYNMDKKLALALALIGAMGTTFGMIDPIKSFFPEEPEFRGLDTEVEVYDHSITPNQIRFFLVHNSVDKFYVDSINIRTKEFSMIGCMDPAEIIPVEPAGMFDVLEITPTGLDARKDHFVTINGSPDLDLLYTEGKTGHLVIDYSILGDKYNNNTSYQFWQDFVIGYSELDDRELQYARYHAHYKLNPIPCR
jgi:hypothetical protein